GSAQLPLHFPLATKPGRPARRRPLFIESMAQTSTQVAADPQVLNLRLPPHSVEAEQSLLGGLMLENEAWDRIGDIVSAEDFYRDDHRRIYRHIAKLIAEGKPADVVTVNESVESSEDKDKTGGLAYLGMLTQNTPT